MQKLQNALDRLSLAVSGTMLAVMMLILIYNVAARYIFGGGISWYMESSQYLNVWAMFVAGISLCLRGEHLRVSVLEEGLSHKGRKFSTFVVGVITTVFYIMLAYATYLLATKSMQNISTMPTLKMSHVYWVLPVASIISAAASALDTWGRLSE